ALESLSMAYNQQYPITESKKGLAILSFRENTESARKNGLGTMMRYMMSERVVKSSRIFYLLERENLDQIMREIDLSQTDRVDKQHMVEMGQLIGAKAFMTGSISEVGNNFVISLGLIDVASATVAATEKIEIPQHDLIERNFTIAMETISQYGLGINFQWSSAFVDVPTSYFLQFTDIYVNYRPFLWLNFKMGGSVLDMGFDGKDAPAGTIYPDLPGRSDWEPRPIRYDGGGFSFVSPYLGLEYNYMMNRRLSFAAGISYVYGTPVFIQDYRNVVFLDDDDRLKDLRLFRVEQELDRLHIGRLEARTQVYLSPRMTFAVHGAFILANDINIDRTTINNEWQAFPDSGNPANEEFVTRYLGISTKILADGKDTESIDIGGGFSLGMTFNFFF
ncbi:MAG TPA: CsgG/HfaB family protein, partial [Calditrichia bacterium]|nr:CsgG/HfaB family protein [Calditrichia bacterium]